MEAPFVFKDIVVIVIFRCPFVIHAYRDSKGTRDISQIRALPE
jgi:hypothetical protein